MSYHILHLLSHNLRVRVRLDQLQVFDKEKGTERIVPLADISVIVAAAQDMSITAGALRRMAELNVLMIVCNEKFEPCALCLPYYRATNTELLRRQIEWTADWKEEMWRQIIAAKVRNQAANLAHMERESSVLQEIAKRCENPQGKLRAQPLDTELCVQTKGKISLARLTASKRAAFLSDSPDACESRAARHYWKCLLPYLSQLRKTQEKRRAPRTCAGVNGMLDYGYAIVRTAVLRSLAAHGFIASIGIAHKPKAGSFALADDLVEPLRPWIDRQLSQFLQGTQGTTMEEWMHQAVSVLQVEIRVHRSRVRLLNAIDLYVQSFARAALARAPSKLTLPTLP
jgi:CRISPR-associated protein Cas1